MRKAKPHDEFQRSIDEMIDDGISIENLFINLERNPALSPPPRTTKINFNGRPYRIDSSIVVIFRELTGVRRDNYLNAMIVVEQHLANPTTRPFARVALDYLQRKFDRALKMANKQVLARKIRDDQRG